MKYSTPVSCVTFNSSYIYRKYRVNQQEKLQNYATQFEIERMRPEAAKLCVLSLKKLWWFKITLAIYGKGRPQKSLETSEVFRRFLKGSRFPEVFQRFLIWGFRSTFSVYMEKIAFQLLFQQILTSLHALSTLPVPQADRPYKAERLEHPSSGPLLLPASHLTMQLQHNAIYIIPFMVRWYLSVS